MFMPCLFPALGFTDIRTKVSRIPHTASRHSATLSPSFLASLLRFCTATLASKFSTLPCFVMSSACRLWTLNSVNGSGLASVSPSHFSGEVLHIQKSPSETSLCDPGERDLRANTHTSTVPIYWALAFIIAAAIPQISNLTSFVGAACILQFSYTFPPMLIVGYNVQKDAMLPEEQFDPRTGQANRVDSGMTRWIRGYKKKLAINTFDVLYSIGALATAGLGIYASVTGMHDTFSQTSITPFTCANPAG